MSLYTPRVPRSICTIAKKHIKAISLGEDDLGRTGVKKHHIDTGDVKPVGRGLRRIQQTQAKAVEDQVEQMLRKKLIKPSLSNFAGNVVLVRKKIPVGDFV